MTDHRPTSRMFVETANNLDTEAGWLMDAINEHYELMRRSFAQKNADNPAYAARAAKDPNFWSTYSVGIVNGWPGLPPLSAVQELVREYGEIVAAIIPGDANEVERVKAQFHAKLRELYEKSAEDG